MSTGVLVLFPFSMAMSDDMSPVREGVNEGLSRITRRHIAESGALGHPNESHAVGEASGPRRPWRFQIHPPRPKQIDAGTRTFRKRLRVAVRRVVEP